MPTFTYGLYPFAWNAAARSHEPPSGASCVLDLRPLSEQARSSQSSGYGLFAWTSSPPGDLVSLGTGYAPELAIDNSARNELRIKLGLSAAPTGATLADAMADVLGSLADPTGASMAKPIMPTSGGVLELHLEGHSRIWSQQIDAAELLSANPRGKHNRIRDVIRADLDVAESIGGAPLLQKALGAKLLSLGFSRDEVRQGASGKKSQWDRLLSAAVKAKHGASAKPRDPDTIVTESWPTDCADISATPQNNSWTCPGATIKVVSGAAQPTSTSSDKWGVCSTPVSSADHICSVDCASSTGWAGAVSRAANSGITGYVGSRYGTRQILYKFVSGAYTNLSDRTIAGTRWSIRSNGSTQTIATDGANQYAITDTAITGNLKGGVYLYSYTLGLESLDSWSLDDELSSGGASSGVAAFIGDRGFF